MKLRSDGVWESNTNLEKYENAYLFKITHELGNEESKGFSKIILDPTQNAASTVKDLDSW